MERKAITKIKCNGHSCDKDCIGFVYKYGWGQNEDCALYDDGEIVGPLNNEEKGIGSIYTRCCECIDGEAELNEIISSAEKLKAEAERLRGVIERVLACNDAITVGALRDKLRAALAGKE